jgi:transposase InsO family protein
VIRTLTVDNGKQFDSDKFKEFCKNLGTTLAFASVYHPESNGVVERANRIIFLAISKTSTSARESGSRNCQRWCGLITPHHLGKQVSHHLNCYMERRQCCQKRPSIRAFE